jgi:hypothetical protein
MLLDYLDIDITEELDLDDLPQNKKQELIEQMTDTLSARLNREALSRMTDEQKEELDNILENDGDVESFLEESVPNFPAVASEIIARFKRDVLEIEGQIRQKLNVQN